jgi:hypothetical protein
MPKANGMNRRGFAALHLRIWDDFWGGLWRAEALATAIRSRPLHAYRCPRQHRREDRCSVRLSFSKGGCGTRYAEQLYWHKPELMGKIKRKHNHRIGTR